MAEEQVWQFLKEKWEILRARITIEVERVDQLSKKSWKWRYCVKFPLTIIILVLKPAFFLIKNLADCFRFLWGFIKGVGEGEPDKFWEENSYNVIRAFGTLGVVVLLVLVVLSPLFRDTSENGSISGKEIVRNTYYLLIFIGAGIAAAIATWRGRQFERQLQNSRFDKAVDMATDPTSEDRRGIGFRTLSRMFFAREKNSDALGEEQIDILTALCTQNFKLSEKKQQKDFEKLYIKNRKSYDEKGLDDIFDETHVPFINAHALALWQGLVNKNRIEFNNSLIDGIYALQVMPGAITLYVFSGIHLGGIHFLVMGYDRRILIPTKDMYANFESCCFIEVELNETFVDYVNFSESHLFRINCREKGQIDYKMSCVGTIFDKANLLFCNFEGADLEGASFEDTNISGSDFSRAKNLTTKQFKKETYWIKPWMPQFPESWTDSFINSLARDAQDEEEEGQGEVKGEPSP